MRINFSDYGLEVKYLVLKLEDLAKFLDPEEIDVLDGLIAKVDRGREEEGKPTDNQYLVINTDEHYAAKIVEIITENEGLKFKLNFGREGGEEWMT